MSTITIPQNMLPADGRFGSGPTKIRREQILDLTNAADTLLGTSHRQRPVKQLVESIREGLAEFFSLPAGYEVVLGNGGASAFWDVVCCSLVNHKAACGVYGSFTKKMAASLSSAPFLEEPAVYEGDFGTWRLPELTDGVDAYCWAQNETSTGVAAPVKRIAGSVDQGALTIIDATSGAGALPVDLSQTDAYYFSPQKAFGSEGGLWVAILSPRRSNVPRRSRRMLPFPVRSAGFRRSSRSPLRFRIPARTRRSTRRRSPRSCSWRARFAISTTTAVLTGPSNAASALRTPCIMGRNEPLCEPVRRG